MTDWARPLPLTSLCFLLSVSTSLSSSSRRRLTRCCTLLLAVSLLKTTSCNESRRSRISLHHHHQSSLPSLETILQRRKDTHKNRPIRIVPQRLPSEAAVIEWGSSAEISAIDAVVANFGPQTSLGAYFEVETQPVLADPVDGVGGDDDERFTSLSKQQQQDEEEEYEEEEEDDDDDDDGQKRKFKSQPKRNIKPLKNKQQVKGNMLVMTNSAQLSGVQMAKIALDAEAEALMIVNMDTEAPDAIYALKPINEEEHKYAQEHIGIPVVMVSLASGNMITTATVNETTKPEDIVNNGMPERIRMYAADDRPFFEDCSSSQPVLYLIHNLLTHNECRDFIRYAENLFVSKRLNDDAFDNYLEGTIPDLSSSSSIDAMIHGNVSSVMLWKGPIESGNFWKQIDDRIEQITGYPKQQFSHWTITRYSPQSSLDFHYDHHPTLNPVVTISVFLNSLEIDEVDVYLASNQTSFGGEAFYLPKNGPEIHILPREGLAFVHHNTDFEHGSFDKYAFFAENSFSVPISDENKHIQYKYVARRYVYASTLSPNRRILLPLFSSINGGKLPRFIVSFHDFLWFQLGPQKGDVYFDRICYTIGSLLVLIITGFCAYAIRKWGLEYFAISTTSTSNVKGNGHSSSVAQFASRSDKRSGKSITHGASKKEQ